ncbi:MAG: hypothetical protein R2748_00705 [Bryobacterales bacterium]
MKRLGMLLFLVGAVAVGALYFTSGPKPRLEGEITEVRTLTVEPEASVALVNFKAENITRNNFVANGRQLEIIDSAGQTHRGTTVNTVDLKDLFQYFPELGGMKDEPFGAQSEIPSGETVRGLIAARFEVSKEALDNRQALLIRVTDGAGRETVLRDPPE